MILYYCKDIDKYKHVKGIKTRKDRVPIFVNHAVADDNHASKLINEIQTLVNNPLDWIDS